MEYILKPIVMFISGVLLLRISGRRSLAQMTMAETIVIISIGSIIVEPFIDEDIKKTVLTAAIFVVLLLFFEVAEYYSETFERLFIGKAKVIIEDGKVKDKETKKLKLTDDELLARLRQLGISKVSDIKKATIETNGVLGYELTEEARPLSVSDFNFIMNKIMKQLDHKYTPIDFVQLLEVKNKTK